MKPIRPRSPLVSGVVELSLEILAAIQSSPEVAQTLLAYGRFLAKDDLTAGRVLISRALGLFEAMGARGWVTEARAAL